MTSKQQLSRGTEEGAMEADAHVRISVSRSAAGSCVRVTGEVDLATVAQLRQALADVDGPIVVDCSELEFIDALGLGALVATAKRTGALTLVGTGPFLRRVLGVAGMHGVLGGWTPSELEGVDR